MATLKYPRKPKAKKYRRKPKASASIDTMEAWIKHTKEVDKDNRERLAAWTKAKNKVDSDKKKKVQLQKTISGTKAKK